MDDVPILAADLYSYLVDIQRARSVGLDVSVVNNDAVGSIEVQVCNDLTPASPNWVAVAFSDGSTSVAVSSGTAINKFISLWPLTAKYMRIFWNATSGTASNTIRVVAHCKHDTGV